MEIRDIISVVKIPSVWPAVLFAKNQIEVSKVQNETHTRIEKMTESKINIEIKEKPDWVSWDEIHEVLWKAHEHNRKKGIYMAFPAMPGDKIKEFLEGRGKMFVAMANDKVVGTGAYIIKQSPMWCLKGKCAYLCFGGILPVYSGLGIHKRLHARLEKEALANGIDVLKFDTHERNQKMLEIHKKNGFRAVDLRICKDHYNIVMVKWLNGCPYSEVYCKYQYLVHKWYKKLRYKPGRIKRFGL